MLVSLENEDNHMDFGDWVKRKREEEGWTLRVLAETANVTAGTVNRLENGKIEATLLTAISLCQALDMDLDAFSQQFVGRKMNIRQAETTSSTDHLGIYDAIHRLMVILHSNKDAAFDLMANTLNEIIQRQMPSTVKWDTLPFNATGLEYLLLEESDIFQHLEMQYPPQMTSVQILNLYKQGGVVTMVDVGNFIQGLRKGQEASLGDMTEKTNVSTNVLQRLELGSLTRLKLSDALHLAKNLDAGNEFLAIVWSAVQFDDRLARAQPWLATVSHTLVKMFRWLDYLGMREEYKDSLQKYRNLMG